ARGEGRRGPARERDGRTHRADRARGGAVPAPRKLGPHAGSVAVRARGDPVGNARRRQRARRRCARPGPGRDGRERGGRDRDARRGGVSGFVGAAYRAAMTLAAAGARSAGVLPGVPEGWRSLGDRLGAITPDERAIGAGAPALWVHAASVGELAAVRPLIGQLRARFPGRACIVSTLTRTGLALARTFPEVHVARLFPIDAPGVVARVLSEVRLEAFLFTETEIWPTWLAELFDRGVPTIMVSGRVSERTLARARWLRRLY